MIGPPGIPKVGRHVFGLANRPAQKRWLGEALKWAAGLYLAGVIAHFGHHMAFDLADGHDPSLTEALTTAPVSLVWPADLIGTLIEPG